MSMWSRKWLPPTVIMTMPGSAGPYPRRASAPCASRRSGTAKPGGTLDNRDGNQGMARPAEQQPADPTLVPESMGPPVLCVSSSRADAAATPMPSRKALRDPPSQGLEIGPRLLASRPPRAMRLRPSESLPVRIQISSPRDTAVL